ncbi:spermatogenesis-associated protein 45-like [Entelurus aequoreus]|uniref:spermatogenesis-associated protein 45-like n=1 Tax=Entelurus aequoreus TaxID=161455 RepID=UPI002B1DFDF7|nr:spermatogenesis-associated protein 45-like [Entelurus aequoreus]
MPGSKAEPLLDVNMQRETWCQVESGALRSWERSERKHYRAHLRSSSVLLSAMTGGPRQGTASRGWPPPANLPQRRHFEESYNSQLSWTAADSQHQNTD